MDGMRLGSLFVIERVRSRCVCSCYCAGIESVRVADAGYSRVECPEISKGKLTIANVGIGVVIVPFFPCEAAHNTADARLKAWKPWIKERSEDWATGDNHAKACLNGAPKIDACSIPSDIRKWTEICIGEEFDADDCNDDVTADVSILFPTCTHRRGTIYEYG